MNNRKYNNYTFSDQSIDDIRHYLATDNVPADVTRIAAFKKKCNEFKLSRPNTIALKATNQVVVRDDDKAVKIRSVYDEVGLGIKTLYQQVSRRYLNIRREDVEEFLKNNEIYQLTKKPVKQINRKIISDGVNKTWGIDLIDMSSHVKSNRGYKFIMTCVDFHSKYAMLRALKSKTSAAIVTAFNKIIEDVGGPPKSLVSDNGLEFKNEDMAAYCDEHHIKQIFGLAYSPTSNALTEQSNGLVRKALSAVFVREGKNVWYNNLDEVMRSINDTAPESTGVPREQLYREGAAEFPAVALETKKETKRM